ncbi:MAG: acyltransferase domain-containing protein [Blastocatellia bacterium]|nr:acyltransferase domain-containing protein [Blastocatellia bacterium]
MSNNASKVGYSENLNDHFFLEPIAVIGISCRFPGSKNVDSFWQMLKDGVDAVTKIPSDRWNIEDYYSPDISVAGKVNSCWGGFLQNIDQFDPSFFKVSPREAVRLDPQQRLLLEVCWEALEDSGLAIDKLAGSFTGVFIGAMNADYGRLQIQGDGVNDPYVATGSALCVLANRVSHFFDFRGPSLIVDTACSSSLVSTHLACQSLWSGESNLALAGGVNLILWPDWMVATGKIGLFSPDGKCKAFDASANGYVRGEGAGVVVLKRLSSALEDKDPIHAIIRASAVGQDGSSSTFKTPSQITQEMVIKEAYRRANLNPNLVGYIEAHGTGTLVGDPIETRALGNIISLNRDPQNFCSIGSVKTNIGHLEPAAGIAGLIKAILIVKNREIPKSLHFNAPNPNIPFDQLKLRVQNTTEKWPENNIPAIAGVNSFGLSGTNAHIIVQEAPKTKDFDKIPEDDYAQLLTISAHNKESLISLVGVYKEFFNKNKNSSIRNIAYSSNLKRTHHAQRLALAIKSSEDAIDKLEAYLKKESRLNLVYGRKESDKKKVVFVFPGQGSQWYGMGKELYKQEPAFKNYLDKVDQAILEEAGFSVIQELMGSQEQARFLKEISIIQPTLFAIQVSLAELWRSLGVTPDVVLGQSMGEVAATHIAGALSLNDAVKVICRRSQLLKRVSGKGAMAVLELSLEETEKAIFQYKEKISVAVSTSPTSTVIAGDVAFINSVINELQNKNVFCRLIKVDVASHSFHVDVLLEDIKNILGDITPIKETIAIYSTVKGNFIDGQQLNADYWVDNLRNPVLFAKAIDDLSKEGCNIFIEVGPHPLVLSAIEQSLQFVKRKGLTLASMRREENERSIILGSLGGLYTVGYPVDFQKLYNAPAKFVPLPQYQWQRESLWANMPKPSPNNVNYSSNRAISNTEGSFEGDIRIVNKNGDVVFNLQGLRLQYNGHFDNGFAVENKSTNLDSVISTNQQPTQLAKEILIKESSLEENYTQKSIEELISQEIAKVLGYSASKLDVDHPINSMGLDSLLALEVKKRIEGKLNTPVPVMAILQGSSIAELANLLLEPLKEKQNAISGKENIVIKENSLPFSFVTYTYAMVEDILKGKIADLLGYSPSKLDIEQPINTLGLDSLMAIKIKNSLEEVLKIQVPIREILQGCSIAELSNSLLDLLNTSSSNLIVNELNDKLILDKPPIVKKEDNLEMYEEEGSLNVIEKVIIEELAKELGYSSKRMDIQQPINMMGLDSSVDIKVKENIAKSLSVDLSNVDILQGQNILELSSQINQLSPNLKETFLAKKTAPFLSNKELAKWVTINNLDSKAKLRLFCFPFAGTGASIFKTWEDYLPKNVNICPIHLPGREKRWKESPYTNLMALVNDALEVLKDCLDIPFAFFGHSMGALISFELTRALRKNQLSSPEHLFVSAYRAPQIPVTEAPIHTLADIPLIEEMRKYGGTPKAVLENTELMAMYLPVLRADFSIFETYVYKHEPPFDCPIFAFGGWQDPKMDQNSMLLWKTQTTKSFDLEMVTGGHFFIQDLEARKIVLQKISETIVDSYVKSPV